MNSFRHVLAVSPACVAYADISMCRVVHSVTDRFLLYPCDPRINSVFLRTDIIETGRTLGEISRRLFLLCVYRCVKVRSGLAVGLGADRMEDPAGRRLV